MFNNYSYALIS